VVKVSANWGALNREQARDVFKFTNKISRWHKEAGNFLMGAAFVLHASRVHGVCDMFGLPGTAF